MTTDVKVWIGIDPGDRWTGIAVLSFSPMAAYPWCAEMGVVDQETVGLYHVAEHLSELFRPRRPKEDCVVIAERYQGRSSGHQRWSDLRAVRLLGALEMVTTRARVPWFTVAPGQDGETIVDPLLRSWRAISRGDQWRHARSAWRVLGLYLLTKDPNRIVKGLQSIGDVTYPRYSRYTFWKCDAGLIAPPIAWRSA